MNARPILFSAPMVQALLEGRKTQTRRIMKPQPIQRDNYWLSKDCFWTARKPYCTVSDGFKNPIDNCPYGQPGDLLWVREAFWRRKDAVAILSATCDLNAIRYAADNDASDLLESSEKKPSIHMPRWASRLTLEITGVRIERLQDITHEDVLAEGIDEKMAAEIFNKQRGALVGEAYKYGFWHLWESINGAGSWDTNPWIWALTFKVHRQNVDSLLHSET